MVVIVSWARYVSERNPAVGRMLTRGVKAFRQSNWLVRNQTVSYLNNQLKHSS